MYEMSGEGFYALPTFAVIPAMRVIFEQFKKGEKAPGLNYGFERILHGEQYTEVKRPLPPSAKLSHKVKIKDIFDKGKNAVVVTSITTTDETGEELAYNELTSFVRGAGGWGGDRGPSGEVNVAPDRKPDAVIEEKTHPNQALLYRLSGDINPLHADPGFATAFGFDKPILHGLCTFGFAARAVIKAFSNGDPRFFKSIKVRFADSVFPGETLVTEMWKDGQKIIFRTKVKERDKVVISNAAVELYTEIPKPKAKKAAAAATTRLRRARCRSQRTSSRAWATTSRRTPDAVKKIGVVYQFKLTSPDATWTVDTKTATVASGSATPAQCTLELSRRRFHGHVYGQGRSDEALHGQEAPHQRRFDGVAEARVLEEDRSAIGHRRHDKTRGWRRGGGSSRSGGSARGEHERRRVPRDSGSRREERRRDAEDRRRLLVQADEPRLVVDGRPQVARRSRRVKPRRPSARSSYPTRTSKT